MKEHSEGYFGTRVDAHLEGISDERKAVLDLLRYAVFIGRFQPFHNEHLAVLNHCLDIAENVIVVIGSSNQARSIKNPWIFEERKIMIEESVPRSQRDRIICLAAKDFYYDDNLWVTHIQRSVKAITGDENNVILVGTYKDSSSYYLNVFPQWEKEGIVQKSFINATDIRKSYFEDNTFCVSTEEWQDKKFPAAWKANIPKNVFEFMQNFREQSPCMNSLREEYFHIKEYRARWEKAPFPPTFVCTDAVVVCGGHILVVKRKFNPGKGLFALPGGFIKQDEKIIDAAIRELKEETGIDIPKGALKDAIE